MALTNLFAMIPAAPGYVGTFDAAVVYGVHAIGGSKTAALSYLLLLRFILFVPITVVGLIVLVTRYGGFARVRDLLRLHARRRGTHRLGPRCGRPQHSYVRSAGGMTGRASPLERGRARHGRARTRPLAPGHLDARPDRRLPRRRRHLSRDAVHAHVRPVGLDHVGP